MAFPEAQDCRLRLATMQLQQGLAASEMGLTVQVARQQFWVADVSHGSKGEILAVSI